MVMADKSKPPPPTDVSHGSILPPGDHYETGPFGTKHMKIRTYAPTVEVGSAFASTALAYPAPERQAAVLALAPKYQAMPDPVLHTIVAGVEPAGPHLGNPDFPEEMLRALGRFEQGEREAESARQEAARLRRRSFGEKVLLLILGGIVTLGLKALLFPS